MAGASASAAGKAGLVPAPAAGSQNKFLRGDGTWQPLTGGGAIPYFIAAADATDEEKAVAYAVCTGTDDQLVINGVTGDIYNRGGTNHNIGGRILLSSGTFWITGEIQLYQNITVEGVGKQTELIIKCFGNIFKLKRGNCLKHFRVVRHYMQLAEDAYHHGTSHYYVFKPSQNSAYCDNAGTSYPDYLITTDFKGTDDGTSGSTFFGMVIEDLYFSSADSVNGIGFLNCQGNGLGPIMYIDADGTVVRDCVFNICPADSSDEYDSGPIIAMGNCPTIYIDSIYDALLYNNFVGRGFSLVARYVSDSHISIGSYKDTATHYDKYSVDERKIFLECCSDIVVNLLSNRVTVTEDDDCYDNVIK